MKHFKEESTNVKGPSYVYNKKITQQLVSSFCDQVLNMYYAIYYLYQLNGIDITMI